MRREKPCIKNQLHIYFDEFEEFNKRCEKLCNAFESIATDHDSISSYSVRGMKVNAYWLKSRVNELKLKLESLCNETV